MKRRLEDLVGGVARAMWVMTFHAACGRILRREIPRLGYRSNFTIYDSADQVRVVKQCLEELERDPKRFVPRGIHAQISNAKNRLVGPEEYRARVSSFYDQTVADVYELYQQRLFASNALDFDDLLLLTVEVLRRFPEAAERWQKAFRYVLVDEYQDTNHAQYVLLKLLAAKPPERLRGRRSRPVDLRLPRRRHPEHPRVRARLRRGHHDPAGAELPLHERDPRGGERGHLQQPRAEAEEPVVRARRGRARARRRGRGRARGGAPYVAAEIARLVEEGFTASEVAVFYRTNAQSRVLEDVLVRQEVPYQVIGGPRFYERAEVKDAVAYLQVIDNPADAVSLGRIANRPRRGIGDTTLARLQTFADAQNISLWDALGRAEEAGCGAAPLRAVTKLPTTLRVSMAQPGALPVPEALEEREQSANEALEAERTVEAQGRIENLQELVGVARVPGDRR